MILFLLFIVFPVAELYVIIRVGSSIGFLNTLGLMVLVAVVGSWLVRREGLRVWVKFNESVMQGKVPTREIMDGVLILAAGALLLTPGFLTDVVGILALFPPTRAMFRAMLMKRARRGTVILGRFDHRDGSGRGPSRGPGDVIDTDGTEPRGEI